MPSTATPIPLSRCMRLLESGLLPDALIRKSQQRQLMKLIARRRNYHILMGRIQSAGRRPSLQSHGRRLAAEHGAATYGREQMRRRCTCWRMFPMACAELWGYARGREWIVSRQPFVKPGAG